MCGRENGRRLFLYYYIREITVEIFSALLTMGVFEQFFERPNEPLDHRDVPEEAVHDKYPSQKWQTKKGSVQDR